MKFQGRGNVYLAERDVNGAPGPSIMICPDSFSISLAVDSFEHINKCGPVDIPDFRGQKSVSGTVSFSFTDVEDRNFAVGVLGTVTVLGSPGTVTAEILPDDIVNTNAYFLGGSEQHRAITALIITDSASPPATAALTTDYTVDAASGRVDFVDVSGFTQPFKAAYGYTDPSSVSLLTASQKEYYVNFAFINKANANDPGSIELYRVRFDPSQNVDFLSDELQVMDLTGTVLADTNRLVTDTEFGQFGRRVL